MISDEVSAFLREYIDSYECLEVLLLLRRERTAWTAEALCTRLETRTPVIDDALAFLVRGRLLKTAGRKLGALYAYAGEDSAKDAIVSSLECAYRDEPIKIMQLLSSNAIERMRTGAIRAFADAFTLRKHKDGG